MKLQDLTFVAADCCGSHKSATVSLPDGRSIGITEGEGVYGVAIYNADGGLLQRLGNQTEAQVDALLA